MRNQKPQSKNLKRSNKRIDIKSHLTVFEPNITYFNDYLEMYIGAKWSQIKNSLYDAGYSSTEVNQYRNQQIDDFFVICNRYGLRGVI